VDIGLRPVGAADQIGAERLAIAEQRLDLLAYLARRGLDGGQPGKLRPVVKLDLGKTGELIAGRLL
jgi:hypothetical protein